MQIRLNIFSALLILSGLGLMSCDEESQSGDECEAKETRCDGNVLKTCQNGFWNQGRDCGNDVCGENSLNPGSFTCVGSQQNDTCKAGQKRCKDNMLQSCTSEKTWNDVKYCDELSCGPNPLKSGDFICLYKEGSCSENTFKCADNAIYRCSSNAWNLVETCGESKICGMKPQSETEMICVEKPSSVCQNGQSYCATDNVLVSCANGRYQHYLCENSECRSDSSGKAACSAICKSGEKTCKDNMIVECGSDGTWSGSAKSCAEQLCVLTADHKAACQNMCNTGETACFASKRYECANNEWVEKPNQGNCSEQPEETCVPGHYKCDGQNLMKCGDSSTWIQEKTCTSGVCNGVLGKCAENVNTEKLCVDGDTFCNQDNAVMTCKDNAFEMQSCSGNFICSAEAGACVPRSTVSVCIAGTAYCATENGKQKLYRCESDGNSTFLTSTECNGICSASHGACIDTEKTVSCARGEHICKQFGKFQALMKCSDDGNDWNTVQICGSGTKCDPGKAGCF